MIDTSTIQKLREQTGAGIVDCKKALEEHEGDIDKAIEFLRKKGIAKAAKRSGREASEGVIKVAVNEAGNEGYMVEVNTETDFVARNEKFQDFADKILDLVKEHAPKNLEELLELPMEDGNVKDVLENLSGVIGEKLGVKRCAVLVSSGVVAAYSHMGGKIGVLVALNKAGKNDLAYDIAMQVAAINPEYIRPEDVPEEIINKEKEIFIEQLKAENKPEEIIDKIVQGKLQKYFSEVCLVKQPFIKDDKITVEQFLKEKGGEDVRVEGFVRFSL